MQYMAKTDSLIHSQAASFRNFETQVEQLGSSINNKALGTLPSDTKANPKREGKEQDKAITLRNGKEIEGNTRQAEQVDKRSQSET